MKKYKNMKSIKTLALSTALGAFITGSLFAQGLSVSVSSPTVDIKKDCTITYTANPSGGCPPYSYSWSSSTGSCCSSTSSSVTSQAAIYGAGTMTVTVTDSLGATASGSRDYHVRKEVETTGPTTGGTPFRGDGGWVSNVLTCPIDSNGCTLTITSNRTISASLGITVSAGVDVGVVKTSVSGTTTTTIASQTGESMSVSLNPGQQKAMKAYPRLLKREGTWSKYGCNGLLDSGTWSNTDKNDPAWEYTAETPS